MTGDKSVSALIHDKNNWGDGPWQTENDREEWVDAQTGYVCLMVRNHMGAWCGYVGVSDGHPAFEKEYDDVDVNVHGGLTYSEHCQGPICHVSDAEDGAVWWIGFDCAHFLDYVPGMEALMRDTRFQAALDKKLGSKLGIPGATYKNTAYVRDEVTELAAQLKEMECQPSTTSLTKHSHP